MIMVENLGENGFVIDISKLLIDYLEVIIK